MVTLSKGLQDNDKDKCDEFITVVFRLRKEIEAHYVETRVVLF